jgi:hypothetical protein
MAQENRTHENVVGGLMTQNTGLLEARVRRMLHLLSGRRTCRENITMAEDCLRASWKLAFATPVFDGSKSNVGGLAGDTKCEAPGGSRLTKAATAEWETDTRTYNLP